MDSPKKTVVGFRLLCPTCNVTRILRQAPKAGRSNQCRQCHVTECKRRSGWAGEVAYKGNVMLFIYPCSQCGYRRRTSQKAAAIRLLDVTCRSCKTTEKRSRPCPKCECVDWSSKGVCNPCDLKRRRERARANVENHPERLKANALRHRATEKFKLRSIADRHKRRAARKSAPGRGVSRKEWAEIVERQGGHCIDCGEKSKLTVGHLVPLCRGGAHDPDNVAGQCFGCNMKQGKRIHPLALPVMALSA